MSTNFEVKIKVIKSNQSTPGIIGIVEFQNLSAISKEEKNSIVSEKLENCADSSALPRSANFFEKLLAVRRTIQNKERRMNTSNTQIINIENNITSTIYFVGL